jgi:hypothetical protein
MNDAMYDVRPEQYTTVIREMIRHENDVTNHRTMWLLIGQGFLANAFVSAASVGDSSEFVLPLVGILVTLSAFVLLYKSYQARGYLLFLGQLAKQGSLPEENLPLMGWPGKRIKGWWREVWVCPWIGQASDLLEPWLFLPCLFMFMWVTALLQQWTTLGPAVNLLLDAIVTAVIFSVYCIVLVWLQGKDEVPAQEQASQASR